MRDRLRCIVQVLEMARRKMSMLVMRLADTHSRAVSGVEVKQADDGGVEDEYYYDSKTRKVNSVRPCQALDVTG